MQIIKVKLEDLKPYANNTKVHTPEQIQQIKDSIKKFGNNDPIAIHGEQNIIGEGHGRYTALKEFLIIQTNTLRSYNNMNVCYHQILVLMEICHLRHRYLTITVSIGLVL